MKLADLARKSFWCFLLGIARRSVGFLLIPLYTSYLNTREYGVIELLELLSLVAGVSLGVGTIADSMVRVYHEASSSDHRRKVVSTALIITALLSGVLAVFAGVFADSLSVLVFKAPVYSRLIRVSFVGLFFGNLVELLLVYQRLRQRIAFFVYFSIIQLTANLLLNIYLIRFAHLGVWSFVLSKLVCAGGGAIALLGAVLGEINWRLHGDSLRKMAKFGGPLIPTGLSFFIIHFADRFFLSHYATLSEVGIYVLAYKFGFLVTFLVGEPFGNIWNVSLYAYTAQEKWREEFARVARYLLFLLVLVALSLSIFIDEILALVTHPSYYGAAVFVPIIACGYVFREVGDFFRGVLFIRKRAGWFSGISMISALFNLALNVELIPRYGISGAAWATLWTWLLYMALCWLLAYREEKVPYPVSSLLPLAIVSAVTYGLAGLGSRMSWGWQWLYDGLLTALFLVLMWRSGYFPAEERAQMRRRFLVWRPRVVTGDEELL